MLDQLRNAAKTWIAGLFVGALVLSFAVWGIGDIFRGVTTTNVAEVGDAEITTDAFDQEFRARVQQLSRQTGGLFTTDQARAFGLDQQVLSRMIAMTALDVTSQKIGLAVSDAKLSNSIRGNAAFQGITGTFTQDRYREVLASISLTEAFYESSLRKDLVRQQLMDAITASPTTSLTMLHALYSFRMEARSADYLLVPPEQAEEISEPDQAALEAFYQGYAPQFMAPQYRKFSFILARTDDFKNEIEVDDARLREIYDFEESRFATPERRTIQVIPFLSQQEAEQARADLGAGFTFEGVAEQRGFSKESITQENIEQGDVLDNVVADAVFALEKDVVSDPINGQLGWALARVTDITPGKKQSFEEARSLIRDEMVSETARDMLYDFSNNLEDEMASGASLEDTATRLGVKLITIDAVDSQGAASDGFRPAALPDMPEILAAAFSQEIGLISDLLEAGDEGYFILRVEDAIPSALKPFEDVRGEVKQAYYKQQKLEKLESLVQSIAERANAGEPFEDIAAGYGRSVLTTASPIGRNFTNETFSAELVAQLFASKVDKYVYSASAFGDSQVIAVTREIIKPDLSAAGDNLDTLRTQLEESYTSDIMDQFVGGLQQQLDVRVYPEAVDALLGPVN